MAEVRHMPLFGEKQLFRLHFMKSIYEVVNIFESVSPPLPQQSAGEGCSTRGLPGEAVPPPVSVSGPLAGKRSSNLAQLNEDDL